MSEDSIEQTYEELIRIIESIKHGSVTAIIQDGKITQIEKNEKVRLKT